MPRERFGESFARGFGTASSIGLRLLQLKKLSEEQSAEEAETAGREADLEMLAGFQADQQAVSGFMQEKAAETKGLADATRALSQLSQLGNVDAGPARDAILSGIGASRFAASAQKYFKSGKRDQIQSFMAAAQGALESGSLQPADLSQALQSDEGFAAALSRLSRAAEAAKASPASSAAQIRIAGINNRIAAIEAEQSRLQQFQPQSEFGINALKTRMGFLDAELRSKITERDRLVTPQINTFAQGTENITQRIDPSTGEPIQIGASELPVFIQQRGQDFRSLIAERGREARAAASRAQSESQFERSQAAIESRFERRAPSGLNISFDEQGRPIVSTGSPKLTESQGKATAFALRGSEAADQLSALEDGGFRPGTITQLQKFAGSRLGSKNRFLSEEGQRYEQAALNFGTAIGRFESGAAISEDEWQRFLDQYIAQPGEGDAQIAQKRQNRETALQGVRIAAGAGAAGKPVIPETPVAPGETIKLPNGTTVEFLD